MNWPSVGIDKVWHVGTLNPDSKGRHSLEGAGLSVSQHPYEWVVIARLGGLPLIELTRKGSQFLDYHALTKKQRAALAQWGVAKGYVELVTAYELSWKEEGEGGRRMSLYETRKEAEGDIDSDYIKPRIDSVPALKPTVEMKARLGVETGLIDAPQHLSTLFAEEELGWDGVWWFDDLDVEALSAPRGVIVPSKVAEWKAKLKEEGVNDEIGLDEDEDGEEVEENPIYADVKVYASGKPLVMPVKWNYPLQQEVKMKPKGFWYACGTEWIDWVRREMPSWQSQLANLYQVVLSPKAKMLYIRNVAEFDAFDRKYRVPRKPTGWMYIDWVRVANDYDGIEIYPYLWQRRTGVNWYYTWDVASGCIWNTEIIADLVPIEAGA